MKIAIYVRVSSPKKTAGKRADGRDNPFIQNPAVQLEPLMKLADARGWEVGEVFTERLSGAKEDRPEYKRLWDGIRKGKFQGVLVWRFDRFARSAAELLTSLNEFRKLNVEFMSYMENIDTSTALGRLMFTLVAGFAEMERENLIERVNAGMEYAREHGTKSGNAIGRAKKIFDRGRARELAAQGMGSKAIAKVLGVPRSTVRREIVQNPPSVSAIAQSDSVSLEEQGGE